MQKTVVGNKIIIYKHVVTITRAATELTKKLSVDIKLANVS